ncbi:MAG: AMP-binding protein [Desulfobacterium sp.]
MVTSAKEGYDFPDFDENAMATTFYTSGTTGNPKGVYFSHRQLVLHTFGLMTGLCAIDSQAVMTSKDVYMPLTPMFNVHAWGMPYLFTMLGNRQVYPGRYEPEMILKLVVGEKVTFSHCVPTIIHMLVNSPVADKVDLSQWKVVIGGSALPKGLCTTALKHKINLYSAYGMSETCPLLTMAHIKPHMKDWDEEALIDIISQHPAVSEAAAIGVADEKWGERPIVLVVLKADTPSDGLEEKMKKIFMDAYTKGVIPKYGVPDKVIFVDEIAKTGVGKLDKKVLRVQYSD